MGGCDEHLRRRESEKTGNAAKANEAGGNRPFAPGHSVVDIQGFALKESAKIRSLPKEQAPDI